MRFTLVNSSRFLGVNPDEALRKTIGKFIHRFRYIEEHAEKAGRSLNDMSFDEMEILWQEAKKSKKYPTSERERSPSCCFDAFC
jgi:XTP/dITP diphosphohydrolase